MNIEVSCDQTRVKDCLSALEVCSREGTIQIHIYLYLTASLAVAAAAVVIVKLS